MSLRHRLAQFFSAKLGYPSDFVVGLEGSFYLSNDTELRPDLIIYRADVASNEM